MGGNQETNPLDESHALELDARDPIAGERDLFHIPPGPDGTPSIYMTGNSLGLQPTTTRAAVEQELDDWARLGVDAHLDGRDPWYSYHEQFREPAARLVGAEPAEVVMMNSLTVNIHLLMVSFYRPTPARYKVVVEDGWLPVRFVRGREPRCAPRARSPRRRHQTPPP